MMTDFESRPTARDRFLRHQEGYRLRSIDCFYYSGIYWIAGCCVAHGNGNAALCVSLCPRALFLLNRIAAEWLLREVIGESIDALIAIRILHILPW